MKKPSFSTAKPWLGVAAAVLGLLWALPSQAAEYIQQRRIIAMGCHHNDGTCYVAVDGAPFGGGEGCRSGAVNEFRWDDADTPNGRRTYASMLAAFSQNKRVSVAISGCSSQGIPRPSYYTVHE
jgi:hypothetical protein